MAYAERGARDTESSAELASDRNLFHRSGLDLGQPDAGR
jgi:hypothetical protein